jgi:hypothetical protein
MRHVAVWIYAAAAALWAAWLPAAAAVLDDGRDAGTAVVAAALTYRGASFVCHQDPARSFAAGKWPWPVCARCAGLYAGAAAGACLGGVMATRSVRRRRRATAAVAVRLSVVRWTLAAAALPTALLWAAERLAGLPVGNPARAVGAVPLGAAVSWLVAVTIAGWPVTDRRDSGGVD